MLTSLTLMSACALATPAFQEVPQEQTGPPLVSLEELVLKHYTPQHVELYELAELGQRMVGRQIYVKERGGYGSQPVANISMLGENLVLYDTEAYVGTMLSSLKELDQPGSVAASPASSTTLATIEYTPSFISLEVALSALGSFQRMVSDRESTYPNISYARERGLLIVRDTPDRLEEIHELLKRIDTPKPQVILTCQLVRGGEKAGGLPGELSSHLERLVPGFQFEQVGFGMLQSAVVPGGMVSLKLDTNYGESFELSFQPLALEEETGTLSVANCTLFKQRPASQLAPGDGRTRVFSTDTMFRGNEYTVLGASGMDPIFVVVRVVPVKG